MQLYFWGCGAGLRLRRVAAGSVVSFLVGLPGFCRGQGTVIFHNTGSGQPLTTEVRSIFVDAGLTQPRLVFDFGFATDETFSPGGFFDSFTVSIADTNQQFSAVYATADASGFAWAPPTPGALFIDPALISTSVLAYPSLQPNLATKNAFEVSAPIPSEFVGQPVNIFFDLFDNQDALISQGWFSQISLQSVPEPQVWVLLLGGSLGWWVRRLRHKE